MSQRTLRTAALPPIPDGPISGQVLRQILTQWQTLILSAVDIRDEASEAAVVLTETIDPLPKVDEPATIESPWTFDELYAGSFQSTAVTATGTVAGANVAATGALTGASATVTGTVSAGTVSLTAATTSTTVGAAGGAASLPATPTGYLSVPINGTTRKIPFYAV